MRTYIYECLDQDQTLPYLQISGFRQATKADPTIIHVAPDPNALRKFLKQTSEEQNVLTTYTSDGKPVFFILGADDSSEQPKNKNIWYTTQMTVRYATSSELNQDKVIFMTDLNGRKNRKSGVFSRFENQMLKRGFIRPVKADKVVKTQPQNSFAKKAKDFITNNVPSFLNPFKNRQTPELTQS